jgi:PhnB protein
MVFVVQITKIPEGYHSVNPYIVIDNAKKFILFLQSVFGATKIKEVSSGGKDYYAEVKVGDTYIMIEENKNAISQKGTCFWVYVRDVTFTYKQALTAGCTSLEPPKCKYGVDYVARVRDPFGIIWLISSFISG